jgi:hypothetical protein
MNTAAMMNTVRLPSVHPTARARNPTRCAASSSGRGGRSRASKHQGVPVARPTTQGTTSCCCCCC